MTVSNPTVYHQRLRWWYSLSEKREKDKESGEI